MIKKESGNVLIEHCRLSIKGEGMFFKKRSNIIYRNYDNFGYITDNRNFGYRSASDNNKFVGDKIVSESGSVFLSVLDKDPKPLEFIINELCDKYDNPNRKTIQNDAIEFYTELEKDGFIISGETIQECNDKDRILYYNEPNVKYKKECSSVNPKNMKSSQDFIDEYFHGEPQLASLHIEITSKCNEKCIHCYIPEDKKKTIMEPEMFYKILNQSREMNLLHITISGGEPLSHKCFVEFLRKCNDFNFSVNVLSNLTLLNHEIIDEMKKNPLLSVQTSIYSMDAQIHDAITQKEGSLEKTKAAVLELIENNIPVQISCPIIKQNMNCYEDVINWGKSLNINVVSDYFLIGAYDGTTYNLDCRMSIEDVYKILNNEARRDPHYLETMEIEYEQKKKLTEDDFICNVCNSSLCIAENGDVYPCAGWRGNVIDNIKNTSLSVIWNNSKKIKDLRNLRRKDFPQCLSCTDKDFCTMCMVRNANEQSDGDPLVVNSYFCAIARLRKKLYFDLSN